MEISGLETIEDLFIWYCCVLGIIGNTLTSLLFFRRMSKFKSYLLKKNKIYQNTNSTTSTSNNNTILIDKNNLLDRRHNWNLYFYFIGINISDMIVLIIWILSKVTITTNLKSKITHNLQQYENETVLLNNQDYAKFLNSLSLVNQNSLLLSLNNSNTNINQPLDQKNQYMTIDTILKNLNNQFRYFKMKLIDIQGICQIYYYFTIISLHGSFAYTLVALLDRIVKLKKMNKEYLENKKSTEKYQKITLTHENTIKKRSNSSIRIERFQRKSIAKSDSINRGELDSINDTNDHFEEASSLVEPKLKLFTNQFKKIAKSDHSELVKQLFGKTSALFVGVIIIFLFFIYCGSMGHKKAVN